MCNPHWDINKVTHTTEEISSHYLVSLYVCLQDPTEEWKVLLRSVFTTWRTSHALPHRQGPERQAFYSRWQEVWHPLAGYNRYLCYFHISYFTSVFPDLYKFYSAPVKIYFFCFFWNWSSSQMSNVSTHEPQARPSRLSVGHLDQHLT